MPENKHKSPRIIGDIYRIGQIISTGGMLTTYTAYNRNTDDVVGLYVIELTGSSPVAQHLLQPLAQRRSVQSAHVLSIHNWGIDGNRVYIVTDPPRGVTMQHIIDNENIDIARAINLTLQIANGVKSFHELHMAGIDLRPQLITIDTVGITDRVQIDDIGLRSLLQNFGYVSSPQNNDIGYLDPRYTTPEFIQQRQHGPASDIYQVGLLLFHLITGRLPFVGSTPAETGVLQSSSPVPAMKQYKYNTPSDLQALVEHILAKDPTQRIPNIDALIAALQAFQPPQQPSTSLPQLTGTREKDTRPTTPGQGLTAEMKPVDVDIALLATIRPNKETSQAPQTSTLTNIPTTDGVYAYLYYDKAGSETQRFAINAKNVILGRLDPKRGVSPDIDLSSIDANMTISRQHARIRFEETFFYIEDLKSRNKTRLGQQVLTPFKAELLQHDTAVSFGSVRMRFIIPTMVKAEN